MHTTSPRERVYALVRAEISTRSSMKMKAVRLEGPLRRACTGIMCIARRSPTLALLTVRVPRNEDLKSISPTGPAALRSARPGIEAVLCPLSSSRWCGPSAARHN